jgi:hypothetical protein
MNLRKLAIPAIATIIASAAPAVLTAVPAHAVSCFQNSCLGQDPQASGCSSGAQTIASTTNGVELDVRYSAACGAYWARVIDSAPPPPFGSYSNRAILYGWTCNPGCKSFTEDSGYQPNAIVWSAMIPTGYWVQACAPEYFDGPLFCTDVTGSGSGPR